MEDPPYESHSGSGNLFFQKRVLQKKKKKKKKFFDLVAREKQKKCTYFNKNEWNFI